jgi:type I restriction enzyme S subunit
LDSFTLLTAELTAELTARKKQYEFYRNHLLSINKPEIEESLLEDVAVYSKERIAASEIDENTYVGVDNLLQDKRGKTISEHVPVEGNLIKYYPEDILIGNIRPYLRKIWFADNIGGTNGDVLVIRAKTDKVIPKYLYYNLSSEKFFEYDNGKSKGAKMPRGDKEAVMKYKLLIPSKDIQKKIVETLDNFEKICNDLNIGLPAEIEARQKQYEFYRDQLLTFAESGNSILQTDRQTDRA